MGESALWQGEEGASSCRAASHVVPKNRPWPAFASQGVVGDAGTQAAIVFSSFPLESLQAFVLPPRGSCWWEELFGEAPGGPLYHSVAFEQASNSLCSGSECPSPCCWLLPFLTPGNPV